MTTVPKLDAASEVIICQHFAAELEAYLKSDVMYWPIAAANPLGDQMPRLTIGGLLEALARADAAIGDLAPDWRAALQAAHAAHDRVVDDHHTAYTAKAAREVNSRLDAWSAYLDDAARKPADVAPYYPHEVRSRAKTFLLAQALGKNLATQTQQRVAAVDTRLTAMFEPGAFVWDKRLQSRFPPDQCWWLYGHLIARG
jgi:hypothetical protein